MVLLCAGGLAAEEANPLDAQLAHILNQHPLVQAQEFLVASRLNAARKSLFSYPDPEIEVSATRGREDDLAIMASPTLDRRSIRGSEVRIMQPIPFPGKGLARAGIADTATRTERTRLRITRNRLAREFLTGLIQLRLVEQQITFARSIQLQLQTLEGSAATRYQGGKTSLFDLSNVRLRLAETELLTRQAETQKLSLGRSLEYFTQTVKAGERRTFTAEETESLLATLEERLHRLSARLDERSLDVTLAREDEKASNGADTIAKMQYLPDFNVFAGYGKEKRISASYQQSMRESTLKAGVTITVPLWTALSNHWEIADKSNELKSNRMKVEDAKQKVKSEFAASLDRIDGMKKALKIHEERLLPGARFASEAASISYASGRGDFATVVQSLELHYEHHLNRDRMKLDYAMELLKAAELLDVIFQDNQEQDHE